MVSSLHISLQRPHHRAGMATLQKRIQRNWSTCQREDVVMRLQATYSGMFEHTNSKNQKQENKEEQVLIWKWRRWNVAHFPFLQRQSWWMQIIFGQLCTWLLEDTDFQDVKDVVMSSALNAALQIERWLFAWINKEIVLSDSTLNENTI